MRLDSVEVKLTFSGEQVARAIAAFGLAPDRPEWGIHFCEDVSSLTEPRTPLLDAGLILRARARPRNKADSTVKLRPGRQSQLTAEWVTVEEVDDGEVKVEADWAGSSRVLAVSHSADRPSEVIPAVLRAERPVSDLFTPDQRRFLADCADIRVNLDALTLLGPVRAVRWDSVPTGSDDSDLEIRAERWTLGDRLDFLELSISPSVEAAVAAQDELGSVVRSHGLEIDPQQAPKTSLVLRQLVAAKLNA